MEIALARREADSCDVQSVVLRRRSVSVLLRRPVCLWHGVSDTVDDRRGVAPSGCHYPSYPAIGLLRTNVEPPDRTPGVQPGSRIPSRQVPGAVHRSRAALPSRATVASARHLSDPLPGCITN